MLYSYSFQNLISNFSSSSNRNSRPSTHRTVRQLSRKNLERQNTLYDEEQYEQPLDTCSEINYNYNNDEYYDGYGYNQQMQNGEYSYDPYGQQKKSLPQPPMSYSLSVNDGFGHRGASLPATPMALQRNNRQLPKYTSPTHQPQPRGLPKLTRQLPSSIESAASTFTSLFGVGRSVKRSVPSMNETDHQEKSLFSLLSESKPKVSQHEDYLDQSAYNENYNYAYNSLDSTDEVMVIEEKYDGINSRMAALPFVPMNETSSLRDYDSYR